MPNMSMTSRSPQLAAAQMPDTVGTIGARAGRVHAHPQPQTVLRRDEVIHDVDRGSRGNDRPR